ncbi:MAG: hypothetical protein ACI3VB_03115 [Oscillospiraceae bacterium]
MACDFKSCQDCGKSHCGSCCGMACSGDLELSERELDLLQELSQTPFLPVVQRMGDELPLYPDSTLSHEECSAVLLSLSGKGLIRIDYDIPITNFDYTPFDNSFLHGSMALTAQGQDILELIDIQGID